MKLKAFKKYQPNIFLGNVSTKVTLKPAIICNVNKYLSHEPIWYVDILQNYKFNKLNRCVEDTKRKYTFMHMHKTIDCPFVTYDLYRKF